MANIELTAKWQKLFPQELRASLVHDPDAADILLVINAPAVADIALHAHFDFECERALAKTVLAHMEPHMNTKYRHLWPQATFRDPVPARFRRIVTHQHEVNLCEWSLNMTYEQLLNLQLPRGSDRRPMCSAILSNKYHDPGQVMRIDLAGKLQARMGSMIDVYGNCAPFLQTTGHVPNKEDVLLQYKYTLNFENHCINNYVTEKFWDAMLCGTYLFYWGAPNILQIVPQQFHGCFSVVPIDEQFPDYDFAAKYIAMKIQSGVYELAGHQTFMDMKQWILTTQNVGSKLTTPALTCKS